MAQTVIGVFDTASEAQRAVETLINRGFSRDNIDVSSQRSADTSGSATGSDFTSGSSTGSDYTSGSGYSSGTLGATTSADSLGTGGAMDYPLGSAGSDRKSDHEESGISRFFKSLFGSDDEADRFSNVANRSESIITVHAQSNDEAERAADILDEMGAVDVDERANQYGYGSSSASSSGSLGLAGASGFATGTTGVGSSTTDLGDIGSKTTEEDATRSIPIIQEQLEVGKRTVEKGGARLRSRIIERPVEESLRLREERVRVERNTVNRAATEADFTAFQEGTIEMTERAEVPVVSKDARVVEEVSLQKDVEERTETIKDTVRHTEVDIEDIDKGTNLRGNTRSTDLTNE